MIIDKVITIDNIELRPLYEDNVTEEYVSWLNDHEITKYTEARYCHHTLKSVRDFVRRCNLSDTVVFLGIFYEGRHIGNIKSDINHLHKNAGIGIIIGDRTLHGKGIGTSVITAFCDYLASDHKIYKINAGAYASNVSSIKVFQKAGFDIEYTKCKHIINHLGDRVDVIMMVRYAC